LGDHGFIVNDEDHTICIRRLIDPRSEFALDCHTADLEYATMHNAPRLGAALAYYTILLCRPLFMMAIRFAGLVFSRSTGQAHIGTDVQTMIGPTAQRLCRPSWPTPRGQPSAFWITSSDY
jgi:hypothetical protein